MIYRFPGNARELSVNTIAARLFIFLSCIYACLSAKAQSASGINITILVNQVAYDKEGHKSAIIKSDSPLPAHTAFTISGEASSQSVFSGTVDSSVQVKDWSTATWYSRADFTPLSTTGNFKLLLTSAGKTYESFQFSIEEKALARIGIPAVVNFFYHQRASSPEETKADSAILLFGSNTTVDLRGGWCDASGDVSKYFSHLAYTNFMNPQQIPMVTWSMENTVENVSSLLDEIHAKESLTQEALYGVDYIMRSLSPQGFFYMTVFSYFKKDASARRIVGLLADSKTTSDYQCAYREGGGMAIAALARISQWKKQGAYTPQQYLAAAELAFAHLQKYNTLYADDGKENIIDDYCALMAAAELWIATGKKIYSDEARKRAQHLNRRLSPEGYFIANDSNRPFWHAADAGLPVIALVRYLDIEKIANYRTQVLLTIKKAIDYNLKVTETVTNPFGYARQSFLYKESIHDGFFIPHENESGWWWQGEDARLSSLATAVITGGRLMYPGKVFGVRDDLAAYAANQVAWILGCNPYNMCMMYGYGKNNVPYMASMYGHGSGKGGISNGITGKDGNGDGSGIDFKVEDNGNEWRWSEQWIPHSAWFLQAITAMSSK
jgi:hypothetical protein